MSEPVPEPAPRASGGNAFMRKIGPLPLWGWMGIALAVALAYYYWRQHQANSQASQSSGTTSDSQIPEFVNQTYVETNPPTPGPQGPPGKQGPPGQPGKPSKYPAPTGEKAVKLSNTSAKVTWQYITSVTPKPTSYTVEAYQLNGKLAKKVVVNTGDKAGGEATTVISGLHPGWEYDIRVMANGAAESSPFSQVKLKLLCPDHMSK